MTAGESNKFGAKVEYYSEVNSGVGMTQSRSQGQRGRKKKRRKKRQIVPELKVHCGFHLQACVTLIEAFN